MAFTSSAVSIEWNRNNLVMRRGASTLLIDAEKVQQLRMLSNEGEFTDFFRTKALVNREARRVFEAWERKDELLLNKLFKEMVS